MKKYRKLPAFVQAEQFFIKNQAQHPTPEVKFRDSNQSYYLNTLSGQVDLVDGDWVIKAETNDVYSCKADKFAKYFEEIK